MIFKRLFQPKYQHKDPAVRIQALAELNPNEAKQKSILHELAFNDSHIAVSLAALDKLNNFDLWWKMALTSKDQRVAKKSRSKVEAFLLGNEATDLSDDNRRTFILECQDNGLLDLLLKEQSVDENDTELMLSVLTRLNKPQLNLRVLLETTNPSLQQQLFDRLTDVSEINKVAKKAKHSELILLAQQKLHAIQEAKLKPVRLHKDVTMVLSKLLALSDAKDYQKLSSERAELLEQFNKLKVQFDILDTDVQNEFNTKFADFSAKIERKLASLGEAWQQQQDALKRNSLIKTAREGADAVIANINRAVHENAGTITLGELEQFNQEIERASQALQDVNKQTVATKEQRGIEALIQTLIQCRNSLNNLPALQVAIQQADALLSHFSHSPLPTDVSQLEAAQQHIAESTAKWQALKEPFADIWPKKSEQAWQTQRRAWIQAMKSLREELDESVKRCRSKCSLILGQINKGSFKNALRHYEKLQAMYGALPASQQQKLQKQYDSVQQEIENLKDWQDYIAAPRKPELLAEIEQIAQHPLPPEAQAAAVKRLRAEWNSLGKTGSENDDLLNQAFDKTCEDAFKPCRDFYAEQEVLRKNNFVAKIALLNELDLLAKNGSESELDKALASFRKNWKAIGESDFKVKTELDSRYRDVINPIKTRLNAWYQENVAQKEALIHKVQALLELDDIKAATQQAIAIQNEWKNLNRADMKSERRLWRKFRAINDALFTKRNQESEAHQIQLDDKLSEIAAQVQSLQQQIATTTSTDDFQALETHILECRNALQTLPKKMTQEVWHQLNACLELVQSKQRSLNEHWDVQQYKIIIDALSEWRTSNVPASVAELSHTWRQAFHVRQIHEEVGISSLSRHELVVMMEIVNGSHSQTGEEAMRKALQLQLMTIKLQDGSHVELDLLLKIFISKGELDESDLQFLPRLASLFLQVS